MLQMPLWRIISLLKMFPPKKRSWLEVLSRMKVYMKRVICFIAIITAVFLCVITTVWAGDEPEALAFDDKSLVFFGEVVSYDVWF